MKSLLIALLLASSFFQEGEKLLMENKPREAEPLLQQALLEDPANARIYLYLGIVYEQLDNPEKAIQVLRRGLNAGTELQDILYFDIGNNYFRQEQYTLAEEMYSKALEANGRLAGAVLNRANSRLKLESYDGALGDYVLYLRLEPQTPQRASIEKLIALLQGQMAEAERKKTEEAVRQKALLNEVLSSLQNASEDTRNLAAGTAAIEEQYDEVDIGN